MILEPKIITLQDRVKYYSDVFPNYPELVIGKDGRITGMWIMGNNYTTKGDYGAYPYGYQKRIESLFPDCYSVLQLFSVCLPSSPRYIRFDINPKFADVVGDPAYSEEDSLHYGVPMVQRNTVVKECYKVLRPGGVFLFG
jgi:SAM-dependent methyltransferase